MRPSGNPLRARRVGAVVLLVFVLAGCTPGTDPAEPPPEPAAGPASEPTPTPTAADTATDPVMRNGKMTSAERYLSGNARAYQWRSFDPVSGTGLFAAGGRRDRGYDFDRLEVVGRTGPVATLTCARVLSCTPKDDWLSYPATLGPGADEITVASGRRSAQVIGYDGTVRGTLDLGAATTGDARVGGLRWTADGSRLAVVTHEYSHRGEAASQVWLADREGGDAQLAYSLRYSAKGRTTDGSDPDGEGTVWTASGWGWSPDGQSLLLDVLRRDGSDVVVLDLQPDGAADPVVARTLYHSDRHFDWAGNVAWSPDGTRIAVRTRHHITEISADDGRVIAQHPHNPGWLIWPARRPAAAPLRDGPVTPGRYRFVVTSTCDPEMGCPIDKEPPLPAIDITVPEGWDAATEVLSLFTTEGRDTTSRNGAALVLGWTNHWVGLNSQPCSRVSHQKPDIAVGPTVEDFVDAVVAHPLLHVTQPRPVRLGRYRGDSFSLFGPKDISRCEEWRPWDPGPYLQGDENRWDLWVMDVDGVRVVVMAEYFPETPADIKADLRAMAESIRFTPGKA